MWWGPKSWFPCLTALWTLLFGYLDGRWQHEIINFPNPSSQKHLFFIIFSSKFCVFYLLMMLSATLLHRLETSESSQSCLLFSPHIPMWPRPLGLHSGVTLASSCPCHSRNSSSTLCDSLGLNHWPAEVKFFTFQFQPRCCSRMLLLVMAYATTPSSASFSLRSRATTSFSTPGAAPTQPLLPPHPLLQQSTPWPPMHLTLYEPSSESGIPC